MHKGSFPESHWNMGRFIGIAWDTGDMFTFKVWSEPDGKWKNGQELTSNIIITRAEREIPEDP